MTDRVRELLDRYGYEAVPLDTKLRKLHKEGRTSDALIAISQALDRAAQAAGLSNWRPVTTAPTDGRHVLLHYRFARRRYIAEGWMTPAGHWSVQGASDVRATHWRPLLAPPPPAR